MKVFELMHTRVEQYAEFQSTVPQTSTENEDGIVAPLSPSNAQWKKEKEHDDDELFFSKDDEELVTYTSILNKSHKMRLFCYSHRRRLTKENSVLNHYFLLQIENGKVSCKASFNNL